MNNKRIFGMFHDFQMNFSECIDDMKTCSYDPSYKEGKGFILVNSEYNCYNFDRISGIICKNHGYEKLQSSDSILPLEPSNTLYLIEFKNSRSSIPWSDIRAKIFNSIFIFENFYGLSKSDLCNIVTVTVIHKSMNKKSLKKIREHQRRLSGLIYQTVEHFRILDDFYGIKSYKFNSEDFIKFIEEKGLV
ncbi:hypothetical protein [Streptococcus salivarius]|uniref:hypothetical protein n=1 Tax=Streptococcus salivarius TaxID=1304 RepID=UPI0022E88C23|nr:hypothetical protein [Streptococcus salivarius]